MSYRTFFIIFLFSFSINIYTQQSYFIKYRDNISKNEIEGKIASKQLLNSTLMKSALNNNFKVQLFARSFGKNIEPLSRIIKVTFDSKTDNNNFIQMASADPDIEYIESSHTYHIDSNLKEKYITTLPNDSLVAQQWGLAKIQAFDAWNITQGSDTVLLGIIDTGIDYLHPDLKDKLYINTGETGTDANGNDKRSNGIDDDGNGFIDDYMGFDFVDRVGFPFDSTGGDYLGWDNNPWDDYGHGTAIAGIAGAETFNGFGIAGVAPKIKMINIRAFDPMGSGSEDDVAAAILYAVLMKCKVINMSFGDNSFSYVLRDVIRYAYSQNIVMAASSGNDGSDQPHYPSGYSECICVGNSTSDDYVSSQSNYGSTLDLVAPGSSILSTDKEGGYSFVSGTSASAPFVSATAALLLAIGNYTNEEVKQIIKSTCNDIGEPGWDIHSGAGRLNLFHALSVPAASIIKFNNPTQDFATNNDTLIINATILSAYFQSYDLLYGIGVNPTSWNSLLQNQQFQFSKKDIYKLPLSALRDTVYNLRLLIHLINGNTLEERVNFYVMRTPPAAELMSFGPSFYGDKITGLAVMSTNQPCVTRMYYRKAGDIPFRFITLDGFNTNNQFIKTFSYGFIPKELIDQYSNYEVYFEAENLVGKTTIIKDNNNYFTFNTSSNINPVAVTELPYTLPAGDIYQNPLNLTSPDFSEVALRDFSGSNQTDFYKLINNNFVKFDSLYSRIIQDYGDFNNNGKKDLLTFFIRDTYIYEQADSNSTNLNLKFADSTGRFWPIMAKDIDGDEITEILEVNSDTSFVIWKVDSNLKLKSPDTLSNFSPSGLFLNTIDSPNAVVTDMYASGKNQIWIADKDGDIFDYKVLGSRSYQKDRVIQTGFLGSSAYLTSGNYLGTGSNVMAVLLHSIEAIDLAPFNRLIVFNFIGDSLNTIYDQVFIDPSSEFNNTTFPQADNSIRFADIDNDGTDELILFIFPYSYIFKYDHNTNKIISYKENINSNYIFVGDLNHNNVKEVGFPTKNGIKFYEFASSNKATTPYNLSGYSTDSISIKLNWTGIGNLYYIYRGTDKDHLVRIDSVASTNYISIVPVKGNYYFAIQSIDKSKLFPVSDISGVLQIYAHTPAKVISVISKSATTVLVQLSDIINNKIDDLRSFILLGTGFPNSISPSSQFSYLLTFRDRLPIGLNKLAVNGLLDHYGAPVPQDTVSFTVDSIFVNSEFFITSYQILNPYKIKITFNLDVDPITSTDLNNFGFQPENTIDKIDLDPSDNKTIYLFLKSKPVGSVGREYTLKISNVLSSKVTGNIKINQGAGSYLVLTSVAQNLSNVYVYPSPVKLNSGKMTFANLPQRVKIDIFTISGVKIIEFEETSTTGGIDFNLRDRNNDLISSGVYIYRIVRFDNSNNEIEEKVGKFAVIKE